MLGLTLAPGGRASDKASVWLQVMGNSRNIAYSVVCWRVQAARPELKERVALWSSGHRLVLSCCPQTVIRCLLAQDGFLSSRQQAGGSGKGEGAPLLL